MPLATTGPTGICRHKTPKLHQRHDNHPSSRLPKTAPNNRTGPRPDSVPAAAQLRAARARSGGGGPRGGGPAVHVAATGAAPGFETQLPPFSSSTPPNAARGVRKPCPCWDLRRSRCKRIHAGRRARRWRRLLRGRRRPGRRFGFRAFHEFKLLRRVQSSFIARFELQLPYFAVA